MLEAGGLKLEVIFVFLESLIVNAGSCRMEARNYICVLKRPIVTLDEHSEY